MFGAVAIALLVSGPPAVNAGTCDAAALAAAAEADRSLREVGTCDEKELSRLRAGIAALRACGGARPPAARWAFPVANVSPGESIGGDGGEGYHARRPWKCYAAHDAGHAAHDLFVVDPDQDSRDAQGHAFEARAVEDGLVLVTREGWTKGDPARGGNYVMLFLPSRERLAYYAHLDTVTVKAGDFVRRGQVVGTIGRTGKNAFPRRSPTHLHFATWDAGTLRPLDPYALLRAATREADPAVSVAADAREPVRGNPRQPVVADPPEPAPAGAAHR